MMKFSIEPFEDNIINATTDDCRRWKSFLLDFGVE